MTTLSMNVDGVDIFSTSIQGRPIVSSGKNTVGAFRDRDKASLFAWIDPVSKEFFQTDEIRVFHPLMLLPLVIIILASMARKYIGIPDDFPLIPVFAVSALIIVFVAEKIRQRNNGEIEKRLRLALKTGTVQPDVER